MKGYTHKVSDGPSLGAFIARLGDTPHPFTATIKIGEEPRRDRQNRFAFEAYKQIAMILGDRPSSDVRAETKLRIGVPLMREQSEAFREKYDRLIRPIYSYEQKLELMIEPFDFPVTRLMTVKQMAEYITQMLAHWDAQGASAMITRYDL